MNKILKKYDFSGCGVSWLSPSNINDLDLSACQNKDAYVFLVSNSLPANLNVYVLRTTPF